MGGAADDVAVLEAELLRGGTHARDELGRRVGLSRSALHERFADMIGQAPMQYLANWRMQVGAALLRDTAATVASVAQEVGYQSEAAFARAFKRSLGKPPAIWRREAKFGDGALTIPGRAASPKPAS